MMQLSLFPKLIPPVPVGPEGVDKSDPLPIIGTKPDPELSLLYHSEYLAWFGAFLMGFFDRYFMPEDYRLTGLTLRFTGQRYIAVLKAKHGGASVVAIINDLTRQKLLRALRYKLRRNELTWKPDKYA